MPPEPSYCQGKCTAVSRVNQQEKLRPGCSALKIPDPTAFSEQGWKMLWLSAASSGERWAAVVAASARPQNQPCCSHQLRREWHDKIPMSWYEGPKPSRPHWDNCCVRLLIPWMLVLGYQLQPLLVNPNSELTQITA